VRSKAFQYQDPQPAVIQTVSPEAHDLNREAMILQYAPFIKYIAHRLAMRLPAHISIGDLIDAGVIGLIDALTKFDPNKNVEFKTYAEFRIRGAMLDELRSLDWVPRSLRQKATQIEKAIHHLEKKRGGPVDDEEIASELGLSLDTYYDLMNKIKGISFLDVEVLQQKIAHLPGEEILDLILEKKENDPFHLLSVKELKKIVASAIGDLPPKEKLVISLYYYEEMTLKEIGETLDLTESRICQIHTKAILRLRGKLKRYLRDDL